MQQVLTDSEINYFNEKGFLILANVLSPIEVANLRAVVDDIYTKYGGDPATGRLEVRNCVSQHELLLNLIDNPAILPVVVNLLGPNIKIRSSHLDVRPPVNLSSLPDEIDEGRWGEPERWHVDGPLYGYPMVNNIIPMMEVKVGFYLTDVVDPNSGPLCVVPGSHKLDHRVLAQDGFHIPQEYRFKVSVTAGSAVIFRTGLWHCVVPNTSDITRKVLYYAYTYRWIQPSDYLAQTDELLAKCSPIRRQLLGATANPIRHPLGDKPIEQPCSFYWYSDPDDIPLMNLEMQR